MRTTPDRKRPLASALAGCALLLAAIPAPAAPDLQQIVTGDVTIEQNADGSVTLIHASDGSIIEYASFDILANELVQFVQPGADARVLNRVFGDATRIDGTLLSNGIVYIVNPAGIFLDGNAVVDVGGLVAAAGNLANEDFLAGVDRFDLHGEVVNTSDAIRGDVVALLGERVENHGRIEARDGLIALVAGERVVLARLGGRVHVEVDGGVAAGATGDPGVVQAGHLDAAGGRVILAVGDHYSLALNHTGVTVGSDVLLRGGDDGTLLVQGTIDASAGADEQGGAIRVLGDRIALLGAHLDASGGAGGGSIRVGGDVRGEGALPTARRTFVDGDSVLRADATDAGDGGSVVVWGDEAAVMAGTISARGGAQAGDGGFAEVSSLGLLDPSGTVDLAAPAGATGMLLLDPQDIVILGGVGDGSDDPNASDAELQGDGGTFGEILFGDVGDGTEPFEIYESEIEGQTANLVLEARNSVSSTGTFDNDARGEGTGVIALADDVDLTIRTRNDVDDELGSAATPGIDLGALDIQAFGTGGVTLAAGDDAMGGGGAGAAAGVTVGDVSTEGGAILIVARNGDIGTGDLMASGLDGATGADSGGVTAIAFAGDISVGDVTAAGGEGLAGAGGNGGPVSAGSGDGSFSIGDVDTRGGDGTGRGGNGGQQLLLAEVQGTLAVGLLRSGGGNGDTDGSGDPDAGGNGGRIDVATDDGSATIAGIDASGGDGVPDAPGPDGMLGTADDVLGGASGRAADVLVDVGRQGDGSVLFQDSVVAVDGDGSDPPTNDGFGVILQAADGLEFSPAIVGADIRTTEDVELAADTIGGTGAVEIDAVGLTPDPENETRTLEVVADSLARVDVTTAGFDRFMVQARTALADIDVTQEAVGGGGTAIAIDFDGAPGTSTLVSAEMRDPGIAGGADLDASLEDELVDMDDVSLALVVAGGAMQGVQGSGSVAIQGEDDVILEDGAITMHPAGVAMASGDVLVGADFDSDGTGAISAAGAGVAIDMNQPGANPTGALGLVAAEGVGAPGSEILVANVDELAAGTTTHGGVHVRNTAGGDVTLRRGLLVPLDPGFGASDAVAVLLGPGDVAIGNDAGDLVVAGTVRAPGDAGSGGDVTVSVQAGDEIRFQDPTGTARVEGAGDVLLDGFVRLSLDAEIVAGGDVTFADAIDGDAVSQVTRNLSVESGGTVRFGGDVGQGFQLRNLTVDGDVELAQDTAFDALQTARFERDVDASADDAAALTVTAGDAVVFGGDVGASGRLLGVTVDAAAIAFVGAADQSVVTGANGIALNTNTMPSPSPVATIGKQGGGLRLESVLGSGGAVTLGPGQKLTVDGQAELVGDTVQVGDVNAQDLAVDSPDFVILARAPGPVFVPGAGSVPDGGTDLFANTITTTSAPTVAGSGPAPRFATVSGSVGGAGAGGLQVTSLSQPITSVDLVEDAAPALPRFFDLGFAIPDPGNESEPVPPPVVPLLPARPGQEAPAGAALSPDEAALEAFLRCVERTGGAERSARGCAPAPGSPLDSPRGEEIARRYERLFGDSPEARAARRLLGEDGAASSAVRRDLALLLAQLRLSGMSPDAYAGLRDRLLDRVRGAQERSALLDAVRAEARGFPI